MPPYCPCLATSNISPNNKVNTNFNGQCSEREQYATFGRHIWHIDPKVHTQTSSSKWRQQRLGSRQSLSPWGIAQLAIQEEASGLEMTRNTLLKQWREREMDRSLCWERNRCCKQAVWRCRGRDWVGEGRHGDSWECRIDDHRAQNHWGADDGCYRRLSERSCKFQQLGWWGR